MFKKIGSLLIGLVLLLGLTTMASARTLGEIWEEVNPTIDGKRQSIWKLTLAQVNDLGINLENIKSELLEIANDEKLTKRGRANAFDYLAWVVRIPFTGKFKSSPKAVEYARKALALDKNVGGWILTVSYDRESLPEAVMSIYEETKNFELSSALIASGTLRKEDKKIVLTFLDNLPAYPANLNFLKRVGQVLNEQEFDVFVGKVLVFFKLHANWIVDEEGDSEGMLRTKKGNRDLLSILKTGLAVDKE